MASLTRISENPILKPMATNDWEHEGAFNGSVVYVNGVYHMVFRALSLKKMWNGVEMQVSSIAYARSQDGIKFGEHKLLFSPSEEWEKFGCEDPKITYFDGNYYIFYTALSVYPFEARGIKLGLAKTKDFQTFEKHPVTTFNSKAMALFPERINGKMAALLTVSTDDPPAKISLALFDKEEDIWSDKYWSDWIRSVNNKTVPLLRGVKDQVQVGASPIKTEFGWLIVYLYIKSYLSDNKLFGVEALLLDLNNPLKLIGRTELPMLVPEEEYELNGNVGKVVFPSGALIKNDKLFVYYGAADKYCAIADVSISSLLDQLKPIENKIINFKLNDRRFIRFEGNPIINPILEFDWQARATYNPAAIYEADKVHILYRSQSSDGTSVFGYASSKNGVSIDENLGNPVYIPRESFENKMASNVNSGCEDPRITKIGERLYMTYTAYDGVNPPRVALTSISLSDFISKRWNWDSPVLISPPGIDDKDACVIKRFRGGGYMAFHRLGDSIWLDYLEDLNFSKRRYLTGCVLAKPRKDKWDNIKIGIACPPIATDLGILLFYHGISDPGFIYKVGAMLLDYDDPRNIIARTDDPIFEPQESYELFGQVQNVVFPCGAIVVDDVVYLYYGGADSVVGVAMMSIKDILNMLSNNEKTLNN